MEMIGNLHKNDFSMWKWPIDSQAHNTHVVNLNFSCISCIYSVFAPDAYSTFFSLKGIWRFNNILGTVVSESV